MTVAELINKETSEWDAHRIRNTLWRIDAEKVLQTTIHHQSEEDALSWNLSTNGQFTVRTCYHRALEKSNPPLTEPGSSEVKIFMGDEGTEQSEDLYMEGSYKIQSKKTGNRSCSGLPHVPEMGRNFSSCVTHLLVLTSNMDNKLCLGDGAETQEWVFTVLKALTTTEFSTFATLCRFIWLIKSQHQGLQ